MNDNNEFDRDAEEVEAITAVPAEKEYNVKKEIYEWVSSILIALVIALVLRNFVLTLVKVDGSSMVPTLHDGERLVVIRLGYKPQAGDVIIFHPPSGKDPYVKRIIGVGGQNVFIDNSTGKVYVDGDEIDQPYINNKTVTTVEQFAIPENHVFVMGDNRQNSHDSRNSNVGFISYDAVMGKAVFRLWPFTKVGMIR